MAWLGQPADSGVGSASLPQPLEGKNGVCDFGNNWILSHLRQHATTTVSGHYGQVDCVL